MVKKRSKIERITNETAIKLDFDLNSDKLINMDLPIPFMAHMLEAMAFHGNFSLRIEAKGDIEVDAHHLIEDLGIVFGSAIKAVCDQIPNRTRYGNAIIPMDEALSQVVLDTGGRPFLCYRANFPQAYPGNFDISLIKEFFLALAHNAKMNLHLICHYGENSHHMVEAAFKAFGQALCQSLNINKNKEISSTKGLVC